MLKQKATVRRWEGEEPPSEDEIMAIFAKDSLRPYRWSNGPHDVYSAHTHPYNKVIMVVRGSITFGLPRKGEELELVAGDRLDLPRQMLHSAVVGPHGVTCLEAHC
jgi:quercetin dioxygenase-like cupin family protein